MPRRVLISGGTGTIGATLVRRFSESGDEVCFTYARSQDQATQLAQDFDAKAYRLDLLAEFDPPDFEPEVLVNNAGVNISGHPLSETTDEEVLATIAVNVMGPLRLCRRYAPSMVQAGFGRIININSLWGLSAPANRLSYALSKHALRAITKSLAQELAPFGVTVNDICPGPIDSAMLRAMGTAAVSTGRFATLDAYLDDVRQEMPIRRLVEPRDVAAVAEFLTTDEAASCNGLAIRVDGGLLP